MNWRQRAKERRNELPRQRVRVSGEGIRTTDLVFDDGHCVEAPLRLSAALGKSEREVAAYCKRRGWTTEVI